MVFSRLSMHFPLFGACFAFSHATTEEVRRLLEKPCCAAFRSDKLTQKPFAEGNLQGRNTPSATSHNQNENLNQKPFYFCPPLPLPLQTTRITSNKHKLFVLSLQSSCGHNFCQTVGRVAAAVVTHACCITTTAAGIPTAPIVTSNQRPWYEY